MDIYVYLLSNFLIIIINLLSKRRRPYVKDTEIQNLDRMHDILENLNIENKEKLSQIQRDIERNTVNDDE